MGDDMPVGAFRDENGTPLTRLKKLAPGRYADQLDDYKRTEFARKQRVMNDQIRSYQEQRRHRMVLGRDLMTGIEFKPRQIVPPGFGMPPRLKKPVTIVPEFTTMFEAAENGNIREPDTPGGLEDWDKMKKEKGVYKRIINPDD